MELFTVGAVFAVNVPPAMNAVASPSISLRSAMANFMWLTSFGVTVAVAFKMML